jgi:hypothetical protein
MFAENLPNIYIYKAKLFVLTMVCSDKNKVFFILFFKDFKKGQKNYSGEHNSLIT